MEIKYHGVSCFEIKNKNITIITDPYSDEVGFKLPKLKANIITTSHNHFDHNNIKAIEKALPEKDIFIAENPGGYEIGGVLIEGTSSFHDDKKGIERGPNTIFEIKIEGITICHLGDLGAELTDEQVSDLNGVDILLIPVGGVYTIDAKGASELISRIEPRIVIPMHYKIDGLKINVKGIEDFIKEMGIEPERMDSLKIDRKELPQEGMRLIVLDKA